MSFRISKRVEFYLQHQTRIEEWAKLEQDVRAEAHDFFCSVREPLEARLAERDGAPALFARLDQVAYPTLFLIDPSWAGRGAYPLAGIGLEWPQRPTFSAAYTGIWLNAHEKERSHRLHPRLVAEAQRLLPGSAKRAAPPAYRLGNNLWWPAGRAEIPQGQYWTDDGLTKFREHLVQAVLDLWDRCGSAVHSIITSDAETA